MRILVILASVSALYSGALLQREAGRVGNLTQYISSLQLAGQGYTPAPRVPRVQNGGGEKAAYRYVSYAGAAYCGNLAQWKCPHCRRLGPDVQLLARFNDDKYKTSAILAVDNHREELVLAFRGTANFLNWVEDLTFYLTNYYHAPSARVHAGFDECTRSMLDKVVPRLERLLSQPRFASHRLVVVGHSLGGAMAVLSALGIQRKLGLRWTQLAVYTYGQPRIGNTAFANHVNALPLSITRIVNQNDVVPHAPPRSAKYTHHYAEMYLVDNHYRVCSLEYHEDPNCSTLNFMNLTIDAHLYVWDVRLGRKGCL